MPLHHFGVQFPGSIEGFCHTQADVFLSHMGVKFSLMEPFRRLFSRATKNELSAGFVHLVGKILQRLQAGGVDGRHIAESQNNDRREIRQTRNNRIDFIG